MKVVRDCFGRSVRLTDEWIAHVMQHQEMADMAQEIERVLQSPIEVRISRGQIRQCDCSMSSMPRQRLVGSGCVSW